MVSNLEMMSGVMLALKMDSQRVLLMVLNLGSMSDESSEGVSEWVTVGLMDLTMDGW
jgi:hypothetical protein